MRLRGHPSPPHRRLLRPLWARLVRRPSAKDAARDVVLFVVVGVGIGALKIVAHRGGVGKGAVLLLGGGGEEKGREDARGGGGRPLVLLDTS